MLQQIVEGLQVVRLAEEIDQRVDHGRADALDVVEVVVGLAVLAALAAATAARAEGFERAERLGQIAAVVSPTWRMPSA